MKGLIAVLIAVIVFAGGIIGHYISTKNRYVVLKNTKTMQVQNLETFHDKMWKTIKSQAKIKDSYAADFRGIYNDIMKGRYSGGSSDGSLMKWIQESNPQYTPELYAKLMVTIEAQREGFHQEQKMIQATVKEMNDMRTVIPTSFWLGSEPEVVFIPISSSVSKNVMETHQDDDLYLGDDKK